MTASHSETAEVPVCRQCLGEGGYYVVEPANPDMRVWLSCTVCRPNALSASPIRPETVKVPVEPVRDMWAAGGTAVCDTRNRHHDVVVKAVWAAMLAARPHSARPTTAAPAAKLLTTPETCAQYDEHARRCLFAERNWSPAFTPKRCHGCPDARPTTAETGVEDAPGVMSREAQWGYDRAQAEIATLRAQLAEAEAGLHSYAITMQRIEEAENATVAGLSAQLGEVSAARDKAIESVATVRELREYDKATIIAQAKRIAELEAELRQLVDSYTPTERVPFQEPNHPLRRARAILSSSEPAKEEP